MELKPGYKQTEVEVIPEDWKVKAIGEICFYQNGTALEKFFNNHSGFSVISIGNYSPYGKFVETGCFISRENTKELQKFVLKRNELAILLNDKTAAGTIIGRALFIDSDDKYIFNQRTMRLTTKSEVDSKYLYFQINGPSTHQRIVYLAKPGTQIYVNTADITNLKIPFPPTKAEQTAIANALSDADALIQSLTRLIAKKRQIKQGAMQTLLNPYENGRLKEGWEEKKLGEIGVFRGGCGFPTRYQGKTDGLYPFYKVSDMNNEGNEKLMINANNWIDEKVKKEIGVTTFPKNTIIFAKIGAAIFLERKKILNQESCIDNNLMGYVFDTNLYSVEYLHYLFQTIPLGKLVSTTALPSLNGKEISAQKYYFPNKLDQTRIATILSGMDAEIAALEAKLEKYRQIKQGMMQNLLTGRIRLI